MGHKINPNGTPEELLINLDKLQLESRIACYLDVRLEGLKMLDLNFGRSLRSSSKMS